MSETSCVFWTPLSYLNNFFIHREPPQGNYISQPSLPSRMWICHQLFSDQIRGTVIWRQIIWETGRTWKYTGYRLGVVSLRYFWDWKCWRSPQRWVNSRVGDCGYIITSQACGLVLGALIGDLWNTLPLGCGVILWASSYSLGNVSYVNLTKWILLSAAKQLDKPEPESIALCVESYFLNYAYFLISAMILAVLR